jgi:MFS transporter, DHA2 family, multidrug resistance protein
MSVPAAASPQAATDGRPPVNRWIVTIAVTVGTLMGAIDASIVNVAVPYIRANLGATVTEITWVSTGYIISLVVIMPLTAWLGATFGRKRVYMTCLAVFITASFFCGQAHSLMMLVVFRCIQGLGAGALQPTEQAILRETFSAKEQGLAMGLYGFAVMIGPAIGPTLGGWITDNYNWPWIFYINLPIGIIGLWMVNQYVHDPPHARARRQQAGVDAVGIIALAVGLGCMQAVLEEGESKDWLNSNFIVTLSVLAVIGLSIFAWWELRRAPKPAVDLTILRNVTFTTGTLIGGILGVSLFSSLFLMPLFMQELLGYPAMTSGLVMMPRAIVMLTLLPVSGMLYNRLGPRVMIGAGLFVAGAGAIMMSRFTTDTGRAQFLMPQVTQGVGFAFIFVALSTASLMGIERARLTSATGLFNLVRQLGASVGTAIFATLLSRGQQAIHAVLVEHINPYSPAYAIRFNAIQRGFMAKGIDAWDARLKALALFDGQVSQQAAVLSFERCFFIIGALFILCVPLVFFFKSGSGSGQMMEH